MKRTLILGIASTMLASATSHAALVASTYTLINSTEANGGAADAGASNHLTFLTDGTITTDWTNHSEDTGGGVTRGGWFLDNNADDQDTPTINITFTTTPVLLDTFSISYLTDNRVGLGSPDSYRITIGGVTNIFNNSTDLTDASQTEVIDLSTQFSEAELTNTTGMTVVIVADNVTQGNTNEPWIALSEYSINAVPEPSSAALLGLGGLALIRRRRR